MAKKYFSVKTSSNFSFRKLGSKLQDVLGKHNDKIIDGLAQMTKRNISEGKLRGLSQNTLEIRRRGLSTFSGHNPSPTSETRPLLYSKRLFNSIKATKDGIEMMDYALEHNDGFNTPEGKSVPARSFIAGEKELDRDKKGLEKIQNELIISMQKEMKSHGGNK